MKIMVHNPMFDPALVSACIQRVKLHSSFARALTPNEEHGWSSLTAGPGLTPAVGRSEGRARETAVRVGLSGRLRGSSAVLRPVE